jgi:hypothetical protein
MKPYQLFITFLVLWLATTTFSGQVCQGCGIRRAVELHGSLSNAAQRPWNPLENSTWRLKGEENATFVATSKTFIYFEHPDTVPYEIQDDTLVLKYDNDFLTKNVIRFMATDSFSIVGETGDEMVFYRMP